MIHMSPETFVASFARLQRIRPDYMVHWHAFFFAFFRIVCICRCSF